MRQAERHNPSETADLLKEYALTKDIQLRNEIVSRHLFIADSAARRYSGRNVDYDDLYQVASLALLQAVDRYDASKGAKFSTFATSTVLGVIKNYFRDHSRNIRMPRRAGELLPKIEHAREELSAQLDRTPTAAQIAEFLGVTDIQVLEALEASSRLNIASLDAGIDDDKDARLMDIVGGEDRSFDRVDFIDFFHREMNALSEVERHIVQQRFLEGRSQREVAQGMHVSQMYISRMERRIMDRFRKAII